MDVPPPPAGRADRSAVDAVLRGFMAKALPTAPTEADMHIPFLEMGANSLVLMEVQRAVEANYGITVSIPQFFEELTTMDALAAYIVKNQVVPASTNAPAPSVPLSPAAAALPLPDVTAWNQGSTALGSATSGELESLLTQQIQTAARAINQVVAQQLQFLGEMGLSPAKPANAATTIANKPATAVDPPVEPVKAASKPASAVVAHRMLSPLEIRARGLSEQQSRHLEELISLYTSRTRRSKELTARFRPVLADSRAAVGFRFTTKEMLYPITGAKARGARIWDVDGNEYIDITMGQGVTLFGHHPDFVEAALADPDNDTLLLGPRPPQAGEAAELICELTGLERATFTNSGTEAVMAALRLARATTKRNKIVLFDNAYHGHSDNVMGRPVWQDGVLSSAPVAPGITQGAVDDLLLLEYGSDEALAYIRKHGAELAAVVVEPIQSRRPDLQPVAFLKTLRQITEASGTALIFDEMITGFRVHPGGAQALFGVQADIATYGKVIAGGLPIGVVAGKARFMDAIDGGAWQFGDASYPIADRTIFGGTFCQHPAAMIATLATLRYLKAQGPTLQQALNRRTDRLAAELNEYFDREEVPIRVVHFGSQFRFAFSTNLELLFYHMMVRGIFIWEWRNYFLSTAHTDADVDCIIEAVKASVSAMRAGGFLSPLSQPATGTAPLVPLSTAQRQLALLAQLSPEGSMAYHVSPMLRLDGPVQPAALTTAVRALMRRHDALRCVIAGDSQRVLSLEVLGDVGLRYVDLSTATHSDQALADALCQHASTPFDLARGPLFEVHLYALGTDHHRLMLKAHHIIADGLSINLLVQELLALYAAALKGVEANLLSPRQIGDYIDWLRQANLEAQKAYWLKQLSGELPVLELPTDRPEPPVRSFAGGRCSLPVPEALLAQLKALSRAQNCTHFMTLLSAYALWLHRLCQQEEVIVGMPVAGRKMDGADRLVGYCTHLIPIRSKLQWQQSFTSYLKGMRDTLLQGYQHADYPYAELIEQAPFKQRRGNLVQAVFNLDRPGEAPQAPGINVAWLTQPIAHTVFALTLNLTEIGNAMIAECDFSRDLFDEDTIAHYLHHFMTLLQGIVDTPEQRVDRLPLLDAAALHQQLVVWNDTTTDYPREAAAHQLFEAQAARQPEAVAVRCGDQALCYGDLNAAANRLAHWLRTQGIGPDVVVGVCLERSPELVIALLGILKAGGAYLPLDPAYPPHRIHFMLADAGVAWVLTQNSLVTRLALPSDVRSILTDAPREFLTSFPVSDPSPLAQAANLAYLIYTSGSTGKPKGTLIEHRSLVNYLSWAMRRYEANQGAGAPLHSSISFDATITSVFVPLISGRELLILPEGGTEIDHIRAALQSGRQWSLVKLTPAHLELLNAMIPHEQLAGLTRFVVLGGEALLERHVAPWLQHAPHTQIINEYGPTETVVGCCVFRAGDPVDAADATTLPTVPIGCPIANTQLYVLDGNYQPVPVGVKGELYIGGDGVARGYHQRAELTAERFINIAATGLAGHALARGAGARLYRTGDVVRYLSDGNLVYIGRTDNQVKVRGFRIELGEIESVLAHREGVREAVVLAQRRSDQDMRLIAYVAPVAGVVLDSRDLRQALAEVLPAHMVPGAIVVLEALPLNNNGKVDRAALPLPDNLRNDTSAGFVDARNDAERKIAAIWRELLAVERVGVDDNFFELGGHSLLVIPLRDRLQQLFDRNLSPVEIFRLPTVATQARFLSAPTLPNASAEQVNAARQAAQRQRDAFRQMKEKRLNRGG